VVFERFAQDVVRIEFRAPPGFWSRFHRDSVYADASPSDHTL